MADGFPFGCGCAALGNLCPTPPLGESPLGWRVRTQMAQILTDLIPRQSRCSTRRGGHTTSRHRPRAADRLGCGDAALRLRGESLHTFLMHARGGGQGEGGKPMISVSELTCPTNIPPLGLSQWFPHLCATKYLRISGSLQALEPPRRAGWRSVGNVKELPSPSADRSGSAREQPLRTEGGHLGLVLQSLGDRFQVVARRGGLPGG